MENTLGPEARSLEGLQMVAQMVTRCYKVWSARAKGPRRGPPPQVWRPSAFSDAPQSPGSAASFLEDEVDPKAGQMSLFGGLFARLSCGSCSVDHEVKHVFRFPSILRTPRGLSFVKQAVQNVKPILGGYVTEPSSGRWFSASHMFKLHLL